MKQVLPRLPKGIRKIIKEFGNRRAVEFNHWVDDIQIKIVVFMI
jgi:hypothetical protein